MVSTRIAVASCLIIGGAGVALGGPASADPNPLGGYTFEAEDGESATWTLAPCADPADNCVQVAETGNSRRAPWTSTASVTVGSWILFVNQPDAILCDDGSSVPGVNNYSWGASTLSGYASINTAGACGKAPASLAIPSRLTPTGRPVAYPNAPIYDAPLALPAAEPPVAAGAAGAAPAAPLPAESDPALVATPEIIAPAPFELTEAEVALPGFNR